MRLQQENQVSKTNLLRKCGAARPHLGSIFEKLLHRKTFQFMQWLLWNMVLRKNNCVWFGRFALLSAFVLFAGGCVVRIAYEFFLDYSLLEVLFLRWRTADCLSLLDFNTI